MVLACLSQGFRSQPLPGFGFEWIQNTGFEKHFLEITATDGLYADLCRSGVAIFRDFPVTLDDFNAFVEQHSSRITVDPARRSATAHTAEIDAGRYPMGMHRENGNLPFAPDIQWFYCLVAAERGSATTLCDGTRVLHELATPVRSLFETRKIKYSRRIPWAKVQRFISVELRIPLESVDESHLDLVNRKVPGLKLRFIDTLLVNSELSTDAIIVSKFSARPAFCNSLLGPSYNYEPPRITWESGDDIEFEVWDDIRDATERCTYDHVWKQGDVIVLDNTRVMHGRRRLADPRRRIFGAQSYRKGSAA